MPGDYRQSSVPGEQPAMRALKDHGRFAYSRIDARPTYAFPNGKRLALYIALNVEQFSVREGRGVAPSPPSGSQWASVTAWREYGNRVGLWRLLNAIEEAKLTKCVQVQMNTACFESCPGLAEALKAKGVEFVGHGYTNSEEQISLSAADERALLARVKTSHREKLGVTIRGWMSPGLAESPRTLDLLAETGYEYCMDWGADDSPFWLSTTTTTTTTTNDPREKRLLAMPYPMDELNDLKSIMIYGRTPQHFCATLVENVKEMRRQATTTNGKGPPLVCAIALHPHIMGYPFKVAALRAALVEIAKYEDDIWFAQPRDIYDHCAAQPAGVVV